jgi:two-component sensor histidine kinase
MSLAHELVYQMEDLSSIEASDYAERLMGNLQVAYGAPEGSIVSRLDALTLDLDRAVPFGLLLNELVSNAIKYAMPSAAAPVRVRLELLPGQVGEEALLSVEDSGPGISAEVLEAGGRGGSLGLSLVDALARQLGGISAWGTGPSGSGTRAEVRFPLSGEGEKR